MRLMHEGYIKVIIEQKPEEFAYIAAATLYQYVVERITPKSLNKTPLYIMTSECIDE